MRTTYTPQRQEDAAPLVVGFNMGGNKKYKHPEGKITEKVLRQFANDLAADKLTPDFKSAPIPEEPLDGGVSVSCFGFVDLHACVCVEGVGACERPTSACSTLVAHPSGAHAWACLQQRRRLELPRPPPCLTAPAPSHTHTHLHTLAIPGCRWQEL